MTVTTRHPWEIVRARFFCRVLSEALLAHGPAGVLDLGAGDGFVGGRLLEALTRGSSVTCFDPRYSDEQIAALHAAAPAHLEFTRAVYERKFDAIVLLDVLEHVADDGTFLRESVARWLRPGGILLISVPAHRLLFTQHDVELGHHRRYSTVELREVVAAAGLAPRLSGSLFGSLLVPRTLEKLWELAQGINSRPASQELADHIETAVSNWPHGALLTRVISGALELDARLCAVAAHWSAPSAGLSTWTLCELRSAGSRVASSS